MPPLTPHVLSMLPALVPPSPPPPTSFPPSDPPSLSASAHLLFSLECLHLRILPPSLRRPTLLPPSLSLASFSALLASYAAKAGCPEPLLADPLKSLEFLLHASLLERLAAPPPAIPGAGGAAADRAALYYASELKNLQLEANRMIGEMQRDTVKGVGEMTDGKLGKVGR